MPKEEDVEDAGDDDTERCNNPDDQGKQHSEVDDSLLLVACLDHSLDVQEELLKARAILRCVLTNREELSLHDSVQGHGVDCDTGALSNNDDESALELKVDEESNVVGPLLTFRQLSEDKESAPTAATAGEAHTLPDSSHWLQIAFRDTAGTHDTDCSNASVDQEYVGNNDRDGEDPFRDFERHLGLYLARPLVEGKEIDGGEGISGVDGAGDEDEDP